MTATAAMILLVALLATATIDAYPICVIESCCDVRSAEFGFTSLLRSRVYDIINFCGDSGVMAKGYCDAVSDGGGWLVVQRQQDGSVNFNRGWIDYEVGFGNLTGEFWYGLRPLHCLTNQGQWQMRIDFTTTDGIKSYIQYSSFRVGSASSKYQLSISGFQGIASSDPFSTRPLNGMYFTTKDRDNDLWSSGNCAFDHVASNAGGWWYKDCTSIRINQQYQNIRGIYLSSLWKRLSFTEMKIRPANCNA